MAADKSCHLRFPENKNWYHALLENDTSKVQEILQKSSKQQRDKLVSNPFNFDCADSTQLPLTKQISSWFQIKYPLQLVVVLGYRQSFDILVDNGSNVFVKDEYGNNILHLMCYILNANNEEEANIRAFYKHLIKKIPQNEINVLLTQKNKLEWNPELTAISLGVLGIFVDIFMTKGMINILLFIQSKDGEFCPCV